jgi:hypothetical protein
VKAATIRDSDQRDSAKPQRSNNNQQKLGANKHQSKINNKKSRDRLNDLINDTKLCGE